MKNKFATLLIAACAMLMLATAPINAQAQTEASALSAVSALPVMLSTAGSVLVVKTVESTARGTLYVLERASDGARVVLSAAGEAIAFIPNALGRALLYSKRLTY